MGHGNFCFCGFFLGCGGDEAGFVFGRFLGELEAEGDTTGCSRFREAAFALEGVELGAFFLTVRLVVTAFVPFFRRGLRRREVDRVCGMIGSP